MVVNKTQYGFGINPSFDLVNAEIYKVVRSFRDEDMHIILISKRFGKFYRKPIKQDYIDARVWVDMQMDSIKTANS